MLINKIHIENYKSLVDFEIIHPASFSVFFGTNAAGKSNIFEILELTSFVLRKPDEALKFFGGFQEIFPFPKRDDNEKRISVKIAISDNNILEYEINENSNKILIRKFSDTNNELRDIFGSNFSRIFLGNKKIVKEIYRDDKKINSDGSNIVKVLERLLRDSTLKEDIVDWLQFVIPEFDDIDIKRDELTGEEKVLVYEKFSTLPFSGNLISDGTENLISLITALYQSIEPQILLIEEPENGLNPKVIKEFVYLCRELSKEKGHTIWLSTHSQSLVAEIKPEEAILVYKEQGITNVKQFFDLNLHNLKMDDAWLSNVLGGGIPW